MYFDFEDYHPDIYPVGRALTRLEVILLSIIFHLVMVIVILVSPKYFPALFASPPAKPLAILEQPPRDRTQFVFVAPRVERPAPKPPQVAEPSDRDRMARAPERSDKPTNPLPFQRGNSPERVDEPAQRQQMARGQGPQPEPSMGQMARNQPQPDSPESQSTLQLPTQKPSAAPNGANGRASSAGGSLGDALRNLQRYVQNEQFDNQGGGGGQSDPRFSSIRRGSSSDRGFAASSRR